MNWPIQRKLQLGFGLVIVTVVFIGVVSHQNTRELVQASYGVLAKTHQVLRELESTRSAILDAESATRGYIIAGDDESLEQFAAATSRLRDHITRLRQETADNPQQQERISLLEQATTEKLNSEQEIIDTRKSKGAKAASLMVGTGRGKAAMDQIRQIVAEMTIDENVLLRRRAVSSEQNASNAVVSVTVLVALALILFSAAYVMIRHDIFERKRVEEALRESEARYRDLFEDATDVIFTLDLAGNFTSANKAAEDLTGFKRARGSKVNIAQVVSQEHLTLARQMLERKLIDKAPTRYEIEIAAKDGRRVPLEVSTRIMYKDGRPVGIQGIARDITSRKQGEEARRLGEERVRSLFEEAPVAYHEIDTRGFVRRVNRAECSLLGFEASEILGKHIWDFVAEEEREKSREAVGRKVTEQQALIPFQREYVRRDGARLILEIHENLIRDRNGAVAGLRSAMLDVTQRKQTEQELERRSSEITLLSELGSLLQACTSTEEAYGVIVQFGPKLFPTSPGAVCVLSASRNLVEAVAVWGESPSGEAVFTPESCWALRSGRVHFVDEPKSSLLCRHLINSRAAAHLCAPMMAQGDALGILHIQGGRDVQGRPEGLEDSKQQLAMTLAEQIGLALANLKLRETLRVQSIRDPLTGLYNRRYMEESLERELRRAARNYRPLGAIMLDLDHFKRYNDTFGHDAGDSVLREFGNFLQTRVREEDIACRFGGEEFVLILPDTSLEVTQQRADQLREGVKHLHVQHRGQALGPVTASLGVAVFPEHGASSDDLFRAADEALFQAKAQGRDRVVIGKPVQQVPETVS